MSAGYSVSLFTDWQTDAINQVWVKRISKDTDNGKADPDLYGARLADRQKLPLQGPSFPIASTGQASIAALQRIVSSSFAGCL